MSKILTPSLYITRSPDAIDALFFGSNKLTSFSERSSLLTEEQARKGFIYNPNKNEGVVRFEYSFSKEDIYIKIKFVETSKLLELMLLGNDPMLDILMSKLESVQNKRKTLELLSVDNDRLTSKTKTKGSSLKDSLDKFSELNKFYFAFGVGDDLSKWSGPFVMQLANAVLTNDESNTRFVEAMFIPNLKSVRMWSRRLSEEFGYSQMVNKFNEITSKNSYLKVQSDIVIQKEDFNDYSNGNTIVRNLVSKYLSDASSNKNVVVAFPNDIFDLPKEFKTYTEISSRNVPNTFRTLGISVSEVKSPKKRVEAVKTGNGIRDEIRSRQFEEEQLRSSAQQLASQGSGNAGTGENTSPTPGMPGSRVPIRLRSQEELNAINAAITIGRANKIISDELEDEKQFEVTAIKLSMGVIIPTGKDVGNESHRPVLGPLYSFVEGLKSLDKKYADNDFILYQETNVRVLKLWKKYGLISDDTSPALVFGEVTDIKNSLYLELFERLYFNSSRKDRSIEISVNSIPRGISVNYLFRDKLTKAYTSKFNREEYYRSGYTYSDRTVYTQYAKDFIEEFKLDDRDSKSSSFGEDISKTEKEYANLINLNNDIIFRHNIRNPNVTELKYNVDNYYAALMGINIRPYLQKLRINSTAIELNKDIAVKFLGEKFIADQLKIIDELITNTDELSYQESVFRLSTLIYSNPKILSNIEKRLVEFAKDSDIYDKNPSVLNLTLFDVVSFIGFIRILDIEADEGMSFVTSEDTYSKVYASMYSRIKRLSVELNVKTLPFFNKNIFINRSCSVLGLNNPIIGSNNETLIAPYSGDYFVAGYSHVIEYGSCYSTFKLYRSGMFKSRNDITSISVKDTIIGYVRNRILELEKQYASYLVRVNASKKAAAGVADNSLLNESQAIGTSLSQEGIDIESELAELRKIQERFK